MKNGMEQIYKFYVISRKNFLNKHSNNYKWVELYDELDKEIFNYGNFAKELEEILIYKEKESQEYKKLEEFARIQFNRWFNDYVNVNNFRDLLFKKGIEFDDDDIDIWNKSIKETDICCSHIGYFHKLRFYPLKHSKQCEVCGHVWSSESIILNKKCFSCEAWDIIFKNV